GIEQPLRWTTSLLSDWAPWSSSQGGALGIRVDLDLPDGSRADYAIEVQFDLRDRATISRERCHVEMASRQEAVFEVAEGHFVRKIPGIRSQLEPDRLALFAASATEEFRPVYDLLSSMRDYSIAPAQINSYRKRDSG